MYKFIRVAFVLTIVLATFAIPFPAKAGDKPVKYYVSLGTSLAAGIQADKKTGQPILTADAYTDQIHQRIKGQIQNLEHIKLGCPSETSQSMIDGVSSMCKYEQPSQLKAAETFLTEHAGEIAFITIDIGANDLLPCIAPGADPLCVPNRLTTLRNNLEVTILPGLKAAAPGVPIIGVNYYNPYLALWLQGPAGQTVANSSNQLVGAINSWLKVSYNMFGIQVADVASAFDTDKVEMNGNMPKNVKTICQLTWNCEFDNIHPNDNGYKVIAKTVEDLLKSMGLL